MMQHFRVLSDKLDTSGAHKESVNDQRPSVMPGSLRRMPTLSYESSIILSQLFLERLG